MGTNMLGLIFFFSSGRTAIEIFCLGTSAFVSESFCYIKSEHFAMWRSRVLVFNEGPVGNFPRIS